MTIFDKQITVDKLDTHGRGLRILMPIPVDIHTKNNSVQVRSVLLDGLYGVEKPTEEAAVNELIEFICERARRTLGKEGLSGWKADLKETLGKYLVLEDCAVESTTDGSAQHVTTA